MDCYNCIRNDCPHRLTTGECIGYKAKTITNREWLNSLTNEEFVEWLVDEHSAHFDCSKGTYELNKITPTRVEVMWQYVSSKAGLMNWLNEERRMNNDTI